MGDGVQTEQPIGGQGAAFDAKNHQKDFLAVDKPAKSPTDKVELQTDVNPVSIDGDPDSQELKTPPDQNPTTQVNTDAVLDDAEQDDTKEQGEEPHTKEQKKQSMVDTIIIQAGKTAQVKSPNKRSLAEKAAHGYHYFSSEKNNITVSREDLKDDQPLLLSSGINESNGTATFYASPTGERVQEITGSTITNGVVMCQCRIGRDIVWVPAYEIAAAYLMANKDTLGQLFPAKDSK